jgi:hypothetical protein
VLEGFTILLIAHIGKIGEGVKARHHHLRDSSFISQEADMIIMVQRFKPEDGSKNRAILTVEKCRATGVFDETVHLNKVDGYLREEITSDL